MGDVRPDRVIGGELLGEGSLPYTGVATGGPVITRSALLTRWRPRPLGLGPEP
jgi:hypothetical protein